MSEIQLRPAQAAILQYDGGRLAVSAVPGSGKTFTLAALAANLVAERFVAPEYGQSVLVVTYLNASVDNFRAAVRDRLRALELPPTGFEVRTMHSLSLEIMRLVLSGTGAALPTTIDATQSGHYLSRAIDTWQADYPAAWVQFLPEDTPNSRARWRDTVEKTAQRFIREAKNARYRPADITAQLQAADDAVQAQSRFVWMLNGIYARYQTILDRQAAIDYDDQVWEAVHLLETTPGLLDILRHRWPIVLEDEAQDSVPLQEEMLDLLTGPDGNWVRVGDPNQAITSTFTAADPRHFVAFMTRPDVNRLPLPNSGRSARPIIDLANALVAWVVAEHPVPEVRDAFQLQAIRPTPPGDAQPNPPPDKRPIVIRVYAHREREEVPSVIRLAARYMEKFPDRTVAVLVPTHSLGHTVSEILDRAQIRYDSLIRGGTRTREVAAAMHALMALLADPRRARRLSDAFAALRVLNHPATDVERDGVDPAQIEPLLRSVDQTEAFLFPQGNEITTRDSVRDALPTGLVDDATLSALMRFGEFLRRCFALRPLSIDDMVLALGDELFAQGDTISELDLSIAYQLAFVLRNWRDTEPEWRLPELVEQLAAVADGRRSLKVSVGPDVAFEPRPGYLSLLTQHSAKGLEWDAVFLMGIDRHWVPDTLTDHFVGIDDFVGGDPSAEAVAQLEFLMSGDTPLHPGRTPTEAAHIDVIRERLRLLYVGITRARRFLHISRSQFVTTYGQERPRQPTTVLGVLHRSLTKGVSGES